MLYFLKRLFIAIPTMFIIVTLSFVLVHIVPGGPFNLDHPLPPQIMANLEAQYHLNLPIWQQYLYYLGNILHGNLGPSFQYKDFSVNHLLAVGAPISFFLGGMAMLLALVFGTFLGTIAALHHKSWIDYTVMGVSVTGMIVPNFAIAPILSLIFGVFLHLLPVEGWGTSWNQAILPIVALALPQISYIARLMRSSMIETLGQNFIRTAKAKGLSHRVVVMRHAFRGAILPVVSYAGPAAAAILTGSVVIEQIFSIPGIGRFFVIAALNRDYTLVMGVVIFYSAVIILMNLIVDMVYGLLDPRIRTHA